MSVKILIVEDDEQIRSFIGYALSNQKYETVTADCGTEALRRFEEDRPDIMILDLGLPDMDGKEVILAGLTSGYVTDYRAFRAGSGSSDRYPRQESISGIGGTVAASRHKPETAWLEEYSSAPGYHILLSHHPEYLPLIPNSKFT